MKKQTNPLQPSLIWHKFIVNFSLFAAAAINILRSIAIISGYKYGGSANKNIVYQRIGNLQLVDTWLIIFYTCMAFGAIYVRQCLAKFETKAPKKLNILMIVNSALNLLFYFIELAVLYKYVDVQYTGNMFQNVFINIIATVILVIVNSIYYKKRKFLFVY